MQNQVDCNINAQRTINTNRNTSTHRNTYAHNNTPVHRIPDANGSTHVERSNHENRTSHENKSYKEIHDSYKNQEIPGVEALQLVSMLPATIVMNELTCVMSYYNAQQGVQEKLIMERLAELGLSEMPEAKSFEETFGKLFVLTPNQMLNELMEQAAALSFNRTPSRTELLRSVMGAYLAEQHLSRNLKNPEDFKNGAFWGKLEELRNIAATADYSGMSEAQKVLTIYHRYDEAFPGFRDVGASWPSGNSDFTNAWNRVNSQFQRELISAFGTAERAQTAYRCALYGHMTSYDIREAIASKYPPPGEMTLRDFSHMLREMMDVGADDGLGFAYNSAMESSGMCGFAMSELMDKPLDINWLCNGFNQLLNNAVQHERTRALGTNKVLEQLFKVNLDSRGFASTSRRSPVDFTSQARILSSKYDNWTAQDYEKWMLAELSKGYEERLASHQELLERLKAVPEPIEIIPTLPHFMR